MKAGFAAAAFVAATFAFAAPAADEKDGEAVGREALAFFEALDRADYDGVERMLAPGFVSINPSGHLVPRATWVSDLRRSPGGARGDALRREWSEVSSAAAEGEGTFIGRSTWRMKGAEPSSSRRVTQHWSLREGHWRLASMQIAMLPPPPEIVTFASDGLVLKGALFKPRGTGPFPAIVYGHGSEPDPTETLETAARGLVARGYLVFGPHRRGVGLSADAAPSPLQQLREVALKEGPEARDRAALQQLEGPQLADMAAAVAWVKARDDVDPRRVYLIGNSFGGILAMMAAEKGLGLAGAGDFAGAAQNWDRSAPFRDRMIAAAKGARIPVYVAQARNDWSIEPTRILGEVLCEAGKPHRARVYERFGITRGDGHGFGVDGVDIWAEEGLAFLAAPSVPSGCASR